MKYKNWQELQQSSDLQKVTTLHELRPAADDVLQFTDAEETKEYLAVHGTHPYGVATEFAFVDPEVLHLLPAVTHGEDMTIFEIDESMLTLQALTLGTGFRNQLLLHSTYRRVGRFLRELADTHEGKAPLLSPEDVAFSRDNGKIYLVPPLIFSDDTHNVDEYVDTFNKGLKKCLLPAWSEQNIVRLTGEVDRGAQ